MNAKSLAFPRWLAIPFALQALLAAALCFVPLFDVLAYEFSFASGLLAALTGMIIGMGAGAQPGRVMPALRAAWLGALAHLVLPLALITANALRVRNCDFDEGLAFFSLLPAATALYSSSLGVLVSRLAPRSLALRRVLAVGLLSAPLAMSLWGLYWQPPIFVYDHLWGHFAGSLYDETILLDTRLVVFRAGTLLRTAAVTLVLLALERSRGRAALMALVCAAGVLVFDRGLGPRVGFHVTRADIEAELSSVVTRPGLVIHLPPALSAQLRAEIADDHAFRLQQLTERFAVQPSAPIHSYVYRDADQKARLMGGRATQIAKPWLREIHVHNPGAPHDVMAHELAHVIAAEFGSRVLEVSARWGVLVNMGLIEGVAEAVTPERGAYDLHTWARALRALGKAPDLRAILGPAGFWSQAPNRAYTVAGSFVRWLLAQHGPEPLKRAYAAGEFSAAYGKPLDALVGEWERFIDALPLAERERKMAEDTFKQPSIFARPCAHEVAQLRHRAALASPEEAVELHELICKHLDDAASARFDLALAVRRAGDLERYLSLSAALLAGDGLTPVQRTRLREGRGEILWARGEHDGAERSFQELAAEDVTIEGERLQWVRLWALKRPAPQRDLLRAFLDGSLPSVSAVLLLDNWWRDDPNDRTLPYLVARQLARADACDAARLYLERAASHPFAPIEAERERLIADCAYRRGELEDAAGAYRRYAEHAPTSGERARALDWIERIAWLEQRSAPRTGERPPAPERQAPRAENR